MINLLNKMIVIAGRVLISIMLLIGCDSAQCMKDYYTQNRGRLIQMRTSSKALAESYAFDKITIIKKNGTLELGFWGDVVGAASIYVNLSDFSLISENPNEDCSPEDLQIFRAIYNDTRLREILVSFGQIEPKAVKIARGAIFVSLGSPLEHPNVNLNGGILMTFKPGFTDRKIVEKIDTDVYLYDTLVY
jgi:hypothetical protein